MDMKTEQTEIVKREVGERVRVNFGIESGATKALTDGILEATVTTSSVDRQGEMINTDGVDTATYMATNPTVLYGHDYYALPIGKALSLSQTKNKIKAKFQLAVQEYDFAKTVYDLVKGGYLNAVSIGGVVRKWSEDYRTIEEMEMVEFSIVPVPANAEAYITSRSLQDATGKNLDQIKREYEVVVRKNMVDTIKTMPDDEINQAIKVLDNLLATLKESAKAAPSAEQAKEVRRIRHITLRDSAKAVATQSERVVRTIKLKAKEQAHE